MNQTRRRRSKRKTSFTKRSFSLWGNNLRKPHRSFSDSIAIPDEFRNKRRLSI
jgi:hypothetical protein